MLARARACSPPTTSRRSATASTALAAEHAAGAWRDRAGGRGRPHRARAPADRSGSAPPAGASTSAARATTRCWRRCASTCATRSPRCAAGARERGGGARRAWRRAKRRRRSPATPTCSRRCRSSVPLWAGGFAAELRDDAEGLAAALRRVDKNPLGSAAGYGVPLLPIDREATRAQARLRRGPRAGDRGPALARQGRGAGALRDRPADAGPRAAGRRPRPLRHARARLRRACRRR